MTNGLPELLTRLRTAVGADLLSAATDPELLARFGQDRDDAAFAELVRRHGQTVLAECRRVIPDPSAADDAFQATFLVLARRASDLRSPDLLSGWLRGVARRIARRARQRAVKRTAVEQPLSSAPEPLAPPVTPTADLKTVLDEELARLPPHYREVIALCDVDGLSRRAAAKRLGIPDSTLSNRLARARALLGRRLLRRGVALGAGLTLATPATGSLPDRLVELATRAACSDTVPAELAPLLVEGLHPMSNAKLWLAALVGASVLGAITTGVIVLSRGMVPLSNGGDGAKPQTPTTSAVSERDVMARQPKPRIAQDRTGAVALTPDGSRIVTAPYDWSVRDSKIVVYNTATWREVASLDIAAGKLPIIASLGISADGKRVFVVPLTAKAEIQVWDTIAGRYEEKKLDIGTDRYDRIRLKTTPDGNTLVGSFQAFDTSKHTMRFWQVSTGRLVRTIEAPSSGDTGFVLTDGGKTIAAVAVSGELRDPWYAVIEWDVATGEEKRRIDLRDAVGTDRGPPLATSMAYTADGKQLVIGGGFTLPEKKLNEARPNEIVSNYPWSGSVWVIDRDSGKLVNTLVQGRHDLIRSLHLSADGKKLFVQPTLPSRWDRTFGPDNEFVEIQRWDTAAWELDWVRIAPKTERWKLLAGTGH